MHIREDFSYVCTAHPSSGWNLTTVGMFNPNASRMVELPLQSSLGGWFLG